MSIRLYILKFIEGNICHFLKFQRVVQQTFSSEILRKHSRTLPVLSNSRPHTPFAGSKEKADVGFSASWCYVQSFVLCHQ
jgi:hypothetical protein